MDSRVVQNQVHEGDEHLPLNNESQQVSPGAEEHQSDHDSKSTVFMNKVKARAKKIGKTFKNFGNHTPHDGDLVEDKEIVEDHEDAPTTPIYDTEAVKSATPTSDKVKNLEVSEVDFGGKKDTGDGEDRHDHDPLVGSLSSTTENNQNIATEKPIVLEKDLQEQGNRPEAYNRPNYQNEGTDPSGQAYDSEDVKSAALVSEKVEDLNKSETDFEGTTVKRDEPHHDPLVEDLSSTTENNQNTATGKPEVLEKDLHEQGSRPEAYNLPNYQNEVTDQSGLVYDNEAAKSATPASEKVKNSGKSEFDFEGTKDTGDREDRHDHDSLVEGLSSTTEINQNIATEKPLVLEKDLQEQGSGPEAYNLPNYQNEVTDPREDVKSAPRTSEKVEDFRKSEVDFEGAKDTGYGEDRHDHDQLVEGLSSTTEINQNIPTEKPIVLEKDLQEQGSRHEADNLPNYQNEVTDPSGLAYDSEAAKSVPRTSEKVEDLRKSDIDFEGTTIKGDEPHHDPLVEDFSSSTEKPIVFENDPHEQGSILESYDLPNHQTKVTDPSGKGSDEINDITKVEESFERLNVQDEPKPIIEPKTQPTFAETEYPLAGRNDLFDPQTKTQHEPAKEETFNNVTNTVEKQPSYESVETQPKHKDETETLSATARETFSPQNDEASKLAHDEKDDRNEEDKVKETHDDYEKVMVELKEVSETSTGGDIGTETKNVDKDQAKNVDSAHAEKDDRNDADKVKETHKEVSETSTDGDIGTETKNVDKDQAKEVPVKDYLAEKLRPGEDDKALSEVISETLHKKKEEPVKKEDEEPNVVSPGKGMVGRFKGAVGSWFYTSEEKQSPQVAGDEGLLKNKDSIVEGERVSQVKDE